MTQQCEEVMSKESNAQETGSTFSGTQNCEIMHLFTAHDPVSAILPCIEGDTRTGPF